jgi:hypothetical protein
VVGLIYAVVVLGSTLLLRGLPGWRRLAAGLCAAGALLIGAGYVQDLYTHEDAWARAADESDRVLDAMVAAVPDVKTGDTLYTFGHPGSVAPGVVVFAFTWDLNGAVKLAFDDPSLIAYPIVEGVTMECGPDSVGPVGPGWSPELQGARYGRAVFVDVPTARGERIDSAAECRRAVQRFTPGPTYAPPA